MTRFPEGAALVYCEGAFNTPHGKTAHGLVRYTRRYDVVAVIDSQWAGEDAGEILDGKPAGIPVVRHLMAGLDVARARGKTLTHFVVGLAPDGGRLPALGRAHVAEAIRAGLNVDCGLHDFLSEDRELAPLAESCGVRLRDVRQPPLRSRLRFFEGKIEEVDSYRIAVLGTDSAVGKRTTAVKLVQGLRAAERSAELIGTGQTSWMQGIPYSIILDSLVNDFVTGEIEHVIWTAWKETGDEVLVLEGQGSLLNPAYPGGFELLAAGRPHAVVLQHAPTRAHYDGFPRYSMDPLANQIQAVELIGKCPVVAVTLNHEGLHPDRVTPACQRITEETGLPCFDVLRDGATGLVRVLNDRMPPTAKGATE
jgi:uncharacterized NAD-dependent epimerase/dehydratase family protein